MAPRAGLHIHTIGARGDILDTGDHVRSAYGLSSEQWVLVRPDGYVAAVVDTADLGTVENHLDTVGVRPVAAAQPPTAESTTAVSAPGSSEGTGTPRTRREHRQARTAAEQRLAGAQRELHQLARQVQRDLRTVRRHGETTAVVARSNPAELAVQGIARLTAGLRSDRSEPIDGTGPIDRSDK